MSTIPKKFSINAFLNKNIKEILSGRQDKFFSGDFVKSCIHAQLGDRIDNPTVCLDHIWYGAKQESISSMIFDFWINDKNISLGEFWLKNFDTDWSYHWLMQKYHITLPMAKAAVRCISCILAGYQCCIDSSAMLPQWRKIWARNFNLYLSKRQYAIASSLIWCEEVAAQRFCTQFPDTIYNRKAISYLEYSQIRDSVLETYGIHLKCTNLLLSQLVLSYLDTTIYQQVGTAKKYVNGIGYQNVLISMYEFQNAIYLIYALIDDYNFIKSHKES